MQIGRLVLPETCRLGDFRLDRGNLLGIPVLAVDVDRSVALDEDDVQLKTSQGIGRLILQLGLKRQQLSRGTIGSPRAQRQRENRNGNDPSHELRLFRLGVGIFRAEPPRISRVTRQPIVP